MVTERRDSMPFGYGGPGIREDDFAEYAGGRLSEVNYLVGRGITAGNEVINGTAIQTLVGGSLGSPNLVTPASSGWLDSDLPTAAALSLSFALGGADRVIQLFVYGISKFGRPIREYFNVPTGTATPIVNGFSAFQRLTAIEFITLTNVAGGDTFFIGQRLGSGFLSPALTQYAPVFALPAHLGTTREFVTGVSTTLSGNAAQGTTTLALTSGAGFTQYMAVKINRGGATEETVELASVSGATATLRAGTGYAHSAAETVERLDIESDEIVECSVQAFSPTLVVPYDTEAAAEPILGRQLLFNSGLSGAARLVGLVDRGTAGQFLVTNFVSNLVTHTAPNTNVQIYPDNDPISSVPAGMTALVNAAAAADMKIQDFYAMGCRWNFKTMLGSGYTSAATARTDGAFIFVDRKESTVRLGLPANAVTLAGGVDMFYGWQDPSWRYLVRIVCRSAAGDAAPRRFTRNFPYPGA